MTLWKSRTIVGERVRTGRGAEDVVGGLDVGDPVAVGLVDGVLEGARTGRDRDDGRPEQSHARDVERLPLRCPPRPCRPRTRGP